MVGMIRRWAESHRQSPPKSLSSRPILPRTLWSQKTPPPPPAASSTSLRFRGGMTWTSSSSRLVVEMKSWPSISSTPGHPLLCSIPMEMSLTSARCLSSSSNWVLDFVSTWWGKWSYTTWSREFGSAFVKPDFCKITSFFIFFIFCFKCF